MLTYKTRFPNLAEVLEVVRVTKQKVRIVYDGPWAVGEKYYAVGHLGTEPDKPELPAVIQAKQPFPAHEDHIVRVETAEENEVLWVRPGMGG